jgi:hypothetical protein
MVRLPAKPWENINTGYFPEGLGAGRSKSLPLPRKQANLGDSDKK